MGKNQSASNITNIIRQDASGNIAFMSGSTMLMSLNNTGQMSGSAPAVSAVTASYADNFTVTGNLTAQTLVVQTITSSVDFVTGSTQFGSLLTNTHVFSGSVTMNPGGLFVSSSGNVGFGTTTPGYQAASRKVVAINGGSSAAQGSILAFMQAGVNKGYVFSIQDDMELWCESGQIRIGNNANASVVIKTQNTDRLTISGTGAATFSSSVTSTRLFTGGAGLRMNAFGTLSQTISGEMTILGHNVIADQSASNTVTVINGGWYSSMIKMYYNEGITFHTSPTVYSANATYPMGDTERMRIASTGNITCTNNSVKRATLTKLVSVNPSSSSNISFNVSNELSVPGAGYIMVEISATGYGGAGSNGMVYKAIAGGYSGHTINSSYHRYSEYVSIITNGSVSIYNPTADVYGISVTNNAGSQPMNIILRLDVTWYG